MALPEYLAEIYHLSPYAVHQLLSDSPVALDNLECEALMHEFTRPANGPFIQPYTPLSDALFRANGKVAQWVIAETMAEERRKAQEAKEQAAA